jgi:hypothetical protein
MQVLIAIPFFVYMIGENFSTKTFTDKGALNAFS